VVGAELASAREGGRRVTGLVSEQHVDFFRQHRARYRSEIPRQCGAGPPAPRVEALERDALSLDALPDVSRLMVGCRA